MQFHICPCMCVYTTSGAYNYLYCLSAFLRQSRGSIRLRNILSGSGVCAYPSLQSGGAEDVQLRSAQARPI